MITAEKIQRELNIRVRESVKLKRNMDDAQTKTKKTYVFKKLKKNNEIVAKLLDAYERYKTPGSDDKIIHERDSKETS